MIYIRSLWQRWYSILLLALVSLIYLLATAHAVHADGGAPNLAYVAGTSHDISVIDISQQKVSDSITTGGGPHMILLSSDARFLYVSQPQEGKLAIFAAKDKTKFCSASLPGQPDRLSLDPSGTNTIYVASDTSPNVTAVDTNNCNIKRTFKTSGNVQGMAVAGVSSTTSGTGNQLWVANGSILTIFDTLSGQQLGSIAVPGDPGYVTIPGGSTVYVTTKQGSIDAVDLSSHKVIPLVSGGIYGPMDYDAITGEVYVPDQKNKQLVVITPVNAGVTLPREPARIIRLGVEPVSVAITSDGQLGFIALKGGNVAMLDVPGRQIVNTFQVGGDPQFIITGMYPPVLGTTPQQASIFSTVLNIGAYVLVIGLFIIPIILFRRYTKADVEDKGKAK